MLRPEPGTLPFRTTKTLAYALELSEQRLLDIAEKSDSYWIPGKRQRKNDGTWRETNNAKPELKQIHEQIKLQILRRAKYPSYLFGGLPRLFEGHDRHNIANARAHLGAQSAITLDIKSFFPSITERLVSSIWQHFFTMPPSVAAVLTKLTVHKGVLPQGWKTSSYLAALALWDVEPLVVAKCISKQCTYTRFVDDITISTKRELSASDQRLLHELVIGMLARKGLKVHRGKVGQASRGTGLYVTGVALRGNKIGVPREKFCDVRKTARTISSQAERGLEAGPSRASIEGKARYFERISHKRAASIWRQLAK